MRESHLLGRFFLTLISLICFSSYALADDEPDYFIYADDNHTEIIGLKEAGLGQDELTIPASVTTVGRYAFEHRETLGISEVENLYINGNPVFEVDEDGESALTDVKGTLKLIDLGSNMSLNNIKNLLLNGYGTNSGILKDIIIQDYLDTETGIKHGQVIWGYVEDEYGEYSIGDKWYGIDNDDPINDVLTDAVRVTLPAEFVKNQIFGIAEIWGRFTLTAALSTFCGEANFYDMDDGSNWLFYVPTELHKQDKELYFKRVKIITEKEGVLIHNAHSTSQVVNLPRINEGDKYIENNIEDLNQFGQYEQKMKGIYDQNMLVGVWEPEGRSIEEIDGEFTNFILYHGMFYPTSGGTLRANRAYLQIPTTDYTDMKNSQDANQDVNLSIVFEPVNSDAIHEVQSTNPSHSDAWFTINGQRLSVRPTLPGIYIHGGKAMVIN